MRNIFVWHNLVMTKIILFISAFVPMYVLFLANLVVELLNFNLSFNITNSVVLAVLCVLTLIGIIGLLLIIHKKESGGEKITILTKKNLTDQHFLNYFSLFVLLALAFDLSKLCFVCVFVLILVFIGIVYVKNNIFYINPLLNILGYSFYDISYTNSRGEQKEIRIFFRGEIDLNKSKKYTLYSTSKNLNFLKEN